MNFKFFIMVAMGLMVTGVQASDVTLDHFKGKTFEGDVEILKYVPLEYQEVLENDHSGRCTISVSNNGQVYFGASEDRNMGCSAVYGGSSISEFKDLGNSVYELDHPGNKDYYEVYSKNLKVQLNDSGIDAFESSRHIGQHRSAYSFDFRKPRTIFHFAYRCTNLREVQ